MESDWADLQEELLNLITSKLVLPQYQIKFRLICRSWYDSAPIFYNYPYLMSYESSKRSWRFCQYKNNFYMEFPELYNTDIRCCKFGWLLMSRRCDDTLFFFSPFNKEKMELPSSVTSNFYTSITFFNLPTSSDCLLVGTSSIYYRMTVIGLFQKGDHHWSQFRCMRETRFVPCNCNPVLHRGLLYCVDARGNIATFDVYNNSHEHDDEDEDSDNNNNNSSDEDEDSDDNNNNININDDENSSWKIYKNCLSPSRLRSKVEKVYLIKLEGEELLYAVFVVHDEGIIKVYRLLEPSEDVRKWELVQDLGDKVLFVSNAASFGGTAPLKSMSNKIYLTKLHQSSGLFYSLDTQKYHRFDGGEDFSRKKCYGFKELDFATWVGPPIYTSAPHEFTGELTWDDI